MNAKKFLFVLATILVIAAMVVIPALAEVDHCTDHNSGSVIKVEGDNSGLVLPAGTTFCTKGSTGNSGTVVSDGVTPIGAYLPPNNGGQTPAVSYYVVYPPVDPTEPPVDPTEPPVDPTEPPVDPTEPPVDPTEPPVVTLTPPPPGKPDLNWTCKNPPAPNQGRDRWYEEHAEACGLPKPGGGNWFTRLLEWLFGG